MKNDPLNELWHSSANRPDPDTGQHLAVRFVSRIRSRRRFRAVWLAWTFLLLTGASILAVTHLVRNGLAGVNGQWALLPLLALPWMTAVYFLRTFIRQGAVSPES